MDPNAWIGICCAVCWGPSTLIGIYKCCKYCNSEQYDIDNAQRETFTTTTNWRDPTTGIKESSTRVTAVHDPACANCCIQLLCWSIGGPISTYIVSKKLYKKCRNKNNNNNNDVVTTQPQTSHIENSNQKY